MADRPPRSQTLLSLALLPLTLGACGQVTDEELAHAVVTSSLETPRSNSPAKALIDSVETPCVADPELAALGAARRPVVGLYPSTCATKSADGPNLHIEFDGCTGPFGRVVLAGGLDATFERSGECELSATLSDSGDLTTNGNALDYEATALIRPVDGGRNVEWSAEWTGTTKKGQPIHQVTDLDAFDEEDTACVSVAGTAKGDVDGYDYRLAYDDLVVCPDQCPSSGVVTATFEGPFRDRKVTVRFDGSSEAHVTGKDGNEFDVALVCAGED